VGVAHTSIIGQKREFVKIRPADQWMTTTALTGRCSWRDRDDRYQRRPGSSDTHPEGAPSSHVIHSPAPAFTGGSSHA
jgi:hypothetical protein